MINGQTTPIFIENSHERPFSIIPKAPTDFWPKNGVHQKSKNVIYGKETYVGWGERASGQWSMATRPPFFVENSHERPFSIIPKANTYGFLTKKCSPPEIKNVIYDKETYVGWGVRETGRWSMDTQPPFLSKIACTTIFNNTYRFLAKKWSPPENQECDLSQGNICGVRCTSL